MEVLRGEVKRRENQDKQRRHFGEMRAAEQELRAGERQKVRESGKTPYFHSRGDVRKLVVQKRKEATKGPGVRDKQAERQERKAAAKEKKRIPQRRQREAAD